MKTEEPTLPKCSVCGTPHETTARFCPQCGRPIAIETLQPTVETPAATRYEDLRVVGGPEPAPVSPTPRSSFWVEAWPVVRRWLAVAALLAALLGLVLPFYSVPEVAAPLRSWGMASGLLAGLDIAVADPAQPAMQAAALVLADAPDGAESAAVRAFLVWLGLGPLWLLICAAMLAIPPIRERAAGKAGWALSLLWLAGAWPVVWLMGRKLLLWADLFHLAGAGFWCALGALCLLELVRRFS